MVSSLLFVRVEVLKTFPALGAVMVLPLMLTLMLSIREPQMIFMESAMGTMSLWRWVLKALFSLRRTVLLGSVVIQEQVMIYRVLHTAITSSWWLEMAAQF